MPSSPFSAAKWSGERQPMFLAAISAFFSSSSLTVPSYRWQLPTGEVAVFAFRLQHLGVLVQQQPYHALTAIHSCQVERSEVAVLAPCHDVGFILQQQTHRGLMAIHSCQVER
eukprot:CAMPEP_0205871478 /NCGR_PEP_ID=MMETSP1083-20121108/11117_1 /ASSEMBLY_ACC=CAM_ASM_000430 /TAXON_ID=97485 /ORGANISM="Prymnesium parvum, Strain Texoma1" /LENGTH=112 /DNA_ID=CAMNT_0053233837 /DNA_START=118 /DNA_END=458 /DNA_ORIENTATION=-